MNPYDTHILNDDGSNKCLKISLVLIQSHSICDGCNMNKKVAVLIGVGRKETMHICQDCLYDISNAFKS